MGSKGVVVLRSILLAAIIFGVAGCSDRAGDLGREFRSLRAQPGHFSGGAWNDAVDRFGGRKQQVMLALAQLFGDGTHAVAEIEAVMGPPDEVLKPGDTMYAQAYSGGDARVHELIVYQWRGGHDFLYFASDGRLALASGWWAALE